MTVVDSTTSSAVFAALNQQNAAAASSSATGATATAGGTQKTLGQDSFLKLLITQLKNQNPLSPQDNTAFVAQLAQFSSLQGIQNLNTTVSSLASGMQSSQALQASALVGRSVLVQSANANFTSGSYVQGSILLPNSTSDLQLNIYDSSNKLVYNKDLGTQASGSLPFAWDGTATDGSQLGTGTYRFEALAKDSGNTTTLTTDLSANVNSVTIGANQAVMLNVNGVGQVALTDVKDIL